jgi:hypothetical protein
MRINTMLSLVVVVVLIQFALGKERMTVGG